MTYKVGPKGQVVLPKALRDALGIRPGDEVDFERHDDAVLVRRAPLQSRLYGALADAEGDLLADLRAARAADASREERRLG